MKTLHLASRATAVGARSIFGNAAKKVRWPPSGRGSRRGATAEIVIGEGGPTAEDAAAGFELAGSAFPYKIIEISLKFLGSIAAMALNGLGLLLMKPVAMKPVAKLGNLDFGSGWEYAPAPESSDHAKIASRYDLFIDGRFQPPEQGRYFPSLNPAREEKVAEFAEATKEDVDKAVAAARHAYGRVWSRLGAQERGKYLFRIARMIQERAREFAVLESLDGGKPIRESRDIDIPLAAAHFFYNAGWSDKLPYAFPGADPQPIGVAGQIIPWNFPLLMAAWKIAPALATGNTVVLKPAETTPLTAMKLAELLQEADLPPGVVNIVTGAGDVGAEIVMHPNIDKIAFTGSTEVGRLIRRALAGSGKKLTLELGGKAANIVFEDSALDQAVEGIVNGIYFNQGQVCCAGSRLFVQESVAEAVLQKLRDRLETLIVGDPLDKNTDIGAINSAEQMKKVSSYIELGSKEGASIYQSSCSLPERGYFIRPILFTGLSQSSRLMREEIFGPVLSMQTFRTEAEVIEKANNTPYGLSAGVWTDKGSKIFNMTSRLRSGVIWANTYNKFDPAAPFGGYKESGFDREGGLHGLLPYLRLNPNRKAGLGSGKDLSREIGKEIGID